MLQDVINDNGYAKSGDTNRSFTSTDTAADSSISVRSQINVSKTLNLNYTIPFKSVKSTHKLVVTIDFKGGIYTLFMMNNTTEKRVGK